MKITTKYPKLQVGDIVHETVEEYGVKRKYRFIVTKIKETDDGLIIEKEPLVDYLLFSRKVQNTNSLTALQDIFEILNIENVDRDIILTNLRISEKYKGSETN